MTEHADAVHFKGKVVETPMCTLKRGSSLIAKKTQQMQVSEMRRRQRRVRVTSVHERGHVQMTSHNLTKFLLSCPLS